jgi:arginine N-succinyltransferase
MTFINLPPDRDIIEKKIQHSIRSFENPSEDFSRNYYIFVLEDIAAHRIVGISMIHAQHGTESEPHYFFKVGQENKFSTTINTGFIHGTLKLGLDTDGPTEIGGLILNPEYRSAKEKHGKSLSFVRFLFMGLNPERFKKMIHSELMPPLDKDGNSPLWEAIGRRFLNMDYHDADVLSRSNKEFILSLFPSDTIYEALLPMEARHAIGKVGEETKPVQRMLESIGFKYVSEVDPFDGGPHYRCELQKIKPIRELTNASFVIDDGRASQNPRRVLCQVDSADYPFMAYNLTANIQGNKLIIDQETAEKLSLTEQTKTNFFTI